MRAVSVLRVLGLLDDDGLPTRTGREVSAVPASPRLGLMLVLARRWDCALHGAAVVAALSVGDPCMYGRQQIAHHDENGDEEQKRENVGLDSKDEMDMEKEREEHGDGD